MAKKKTTPRRYREDLSEMPDWLRKKACPNRDRYMSGTRILPKNITGREKLPDLVDEVFLAYNSARLREVCQLFLRNFSCWRLLDSGSTPAMSETDALIAAASSMVSVLTEPNPCRTPPTFALPGMTVRRNVPFNSLAIVSPDAVIVAPA